MARHRWGEIRAADLKDVEEGGIAKNCHACGKPHTKIVRVIEARTVLDLPKRSKNLFGACTNKACWRYVDLSKVWSWVRENQPLPGDPVALPPVVEQQTAVPA